MSEQQTVPHRSEGLPLRGLRVEVVSGPDAGQKLSASTDAITIGTAPGNDLVLTDETVSRYHLELRRKGDRISVQDHGSTNGTALGAALLERATVTPGAILKLGRTTIRVDDGELVTVELHDEDALGPLRGRSPAMRRLMASLKRAAPTDISILLLGETGVGKEVIARAIHESSARAMGPFETVDCGALAPTLIASELFGHEKGAFTSADRQHTGAFERAHGGTLFLDEIGELPSSLQPALLGALERRAFRRLGGTKQISVDVRVICATNRDLRAEVNAGSFRQDLYFRIAVLLIQIPPLRERAADIPLLSEHFLRLAGSDVPLEEVIPRETMKQLKEYRWPGNVRELRNFVEASLAVGEPPLLEGGPDGAGPGAGAPASGSGAGGASEGVPGSFPSVPVPELIKKSYKDARSLLLDEFEELYLRELLSRAQGNVSRAARDAQMSRQYLIDMLKRRGIR